MKYEGRSLLAGGKFPDGCTKLLAEQVVSKMVYDKISKTAQKDKLILTTGSALLEHRGSEKALEVSQKMRILARVVLEGRKVSGMNNATLLELLKPQYFDTLVSSCRNIAGYEENNGSTYNKTYRAPATAVHSGYELKRAADVLMGQAIRKQDKELLEDVQAFLHLYRTEWHGKITAPALNNLKLKRLNAPDVLPLTSDLMVVRKYLVEKLSSLTDIVTNDATKQNWRELAEVCLTRMIMFNKRRGK